MMFEQITFWLSIRFSGKELSYYNMFRNVLELFSLEKHNQKHNQNIHKKDRQSKQVKIVKIGNVKYFYFFVPVTRRIHMRLA
jgi:hypothetical protein